MSESCGEDTLVKCAYMHLDYFELDGRKVVGVVEAIFVMVVALR